MRKVILNMIAEEKRGAVLDGEKVTEWLFERGDQSAQSGNIFLGKVMDIVPGMEAAFVDIGGEKNGFLYRNELIDVQPYKDKQMEEAQVPSINQLLTKGQTIIVQVAKEAAGTKGARLTEVCSLPGKYIVYLPFGDYVAVSKKMRSEMVREAWRKKAKSWLNDREGVIIRTVAEGIDETLILNELNRLRVQYEEILKKSKEVAKPPVLLYNQSSLIYRVLRDYFSDGRTEIMVDVREDYDRLMEWSGEDEKDRVKLFQGKEDIFSAYDLEKQLEKSLRKNVWLKNGGFLVIDRTEALTVIDVNTGKFIGKENLQDTVVKTNMEAAQTVAEQLKLRDIGGIILIDFIDMKNPNDREQVLTTLKKAVAKDRTITNVGGFTKFGLVEMTRKKTRVSLGTHIFSQCTTCSGTGMVQSPQSSFSALQRELLSFRHIDSDAMLIEVTPTLLEVLLKDKKEKLNQLEKQFGKTIYILPIRVEEKTTPVNHIIRLVGDKEEIKGIWTRRSSEKS
ncbi:ribonuclease G [Evansella vedderi]|uniref:Ribonuclease G n=1 Tax=Evansella vedderi TaxID=38282 RepID=A0ABT9ZZ51_9BACI|nr:Rne/Rng family ribonuclease [Evansella vedderi]MDQ0256521.1 ribonuclease G [Evansella vedderi]